jgi:hypothetical protein
MALEVDAEISLDRPRESSLRGKSAGCLRAVNIGDGFRVLNRSPQLPGLQGLTGVCKFYYMKEDAPLTDALRRAITESGRSFKALEKETGVLRQSLMRFIRGEQSLRLDMADRLAVYFGLKLQPKRKGR